MAVPLPKTRKQVAEENRILRTGAIVGTKQKRQDFRTNQAAIRRERGLARMTEPQRQDFLKKESASNDAKAKKDAQKAAVAKRKEDDKILKKGAIVGTKAERQELRDRQASIRRERHLGTLTDPQKQDFLQKEQAAKDNKAAATKKKEDDKLRRQVGVVGNEEKRKAWREGKKRVARQDMMSRMSEGQKAAFLEAERAAAERAENIAKEKEATRVKNQVAVVRDKEGREEWRAAKEQKVLADEPPPNSVRTADNPPQTPAALYRPAGSALAAAHLTGRMAALNVSIALLS